MLTSSKIGGNQEIGNSLEMPKVSKREIPSKIDAGWGSVSTINECTCKECGCNVIDYHTDVKKIEKYQTMIDELYEKTTFSKTEVRRLKIRRDILMKKVWSELEEIGYWIRREILRDRHIPIEWRTGEYRVEDGEENAEATDWESDEVSDEE